MTPERLLELADYVRGAVTGNPVGAGPRTPPRSAFRDGPSGRQAWLRQAEKASSTPSANLDAKD